MLTITLPFHPNVYHNEVATSRSAPPGKGAELESCSSKKLAPFWQGIWINWMNWSLLQKSIKEMFLAGDASSTAFWDLQFIDIVKHTR